MASDWRAEITKGVDEALAQGFFLALLSPEAVHSEYVTLEISYALERRAAGASNVIPVVVRDFPVHELYRDPSLSEVASIQFFELTDEDRRAGISELIRLLKAHPV